MVEDNDAVLICTGSWKSRRLGIPGEDLPGVYSGLEFLFPLRACKIGGSCVPVPDIEGRRVVVVGAGHSAVDVCTSALKHRAAEISLVYRRTLRDAPAGSYEISMLQRRGVRWLESSSPVRIVGRDRVEGIEVRPAQCPPAAEAGESGGSVVLPADLVVYSIGEIPNPPFAKELGLENMAGDRVNWLQMTRLKGVFVAGDALTGPSKIGKAIFSGLKAAVHLNRWLDLKAQGQEIEYAPPAPGEDGEDGEACGA
jgi:glutamate synthase (NADPH/NADH) small chain